jgi:hypothetical protein
MLGAFHKVIHMSVIQNKWVEKLRKKKVHETAASYASVDYDIIDSSKKPNKRSSLASGATMHRTLRGVRK